VQQTAARHSVGARRAPLRGRPAGRPVTPPACRIVRARRTFLF